MWEGSSIAWIKWKKCVWLSLKFNNFSISLVLNCFVGIHTWFTNSKIHANLSNLTIYYVIPSTSILLSSSCNIGHHKVREAFQKIPSKLWDIYQKGGMGSEIYDNNSFYNCDIILIIIIKKLLQNNVSILLLSQFFMSHFPQVG